MNRYSTQFFAQAANDVVLAGVQCEVGEPGVQEVVACITSRSVEAMISHMRVNILAVGDLILEGDVVVHGEAEPPSGAVNIWRGWAVLSVQRAVGVAGRPLHVYVAVNAGREGWCVFMSDFHSLVHVLRNNEMRAEHLNVEYDVCEAMCAQRSYQLVPLVRPALQRIPANLCMYGNRSFSYLYSRREQGIKLAAVRALASSDEVVALAMQNALLVDYCRLHDPDSGWCLLAGFDVQNRKHRAAGRCSMSQPVVQVAREETEAREFLVGVRPLLKGQDPTTVNEFLRNFTRVNTVGWVEALQLLGGVLTLREAAFHHVCRLPLQYLRQHAPPTLYNKITHTHTLSRRRRWQIHKDI